MSFKDSVEADISKVFLNLDEFAETRDVTYNGTKYTDVPVVLSLIEEKDRGAQQSDHAAGLYMVSYKMDCALADIGGMLPERGMKLRLSEGSFYKDFYIATSHLNAGIVRLSLEAIDE